MVRHIHIQKKKYGNTHQYIQILNMYENVQHKLQIYQGMANYSVHQNYIYTHTHARTHKNKDTHTKRGYI
jgi:hypothetical protein